MRGPGLNWKFIFRVIGFILILESLFIFISACVAYYFQGTDLHSLLLSAAITFTCGLIVSLSTGLKKVYLIGKREGYLSVALSWISFALFGSLPFFLSGEIPSFSDAFFESTSGITTTGASILTDVDVISKGLLFWRSILQWLGGMGIIVFSLALLPLLGGGASQLFDAESTGLTHDKFRPRVTQMAKRLLAIYLIITSLLMILLSLGPMNLYDAVCHSFTTISTGGFSTRQASIAHWDSTYIESILLIFMIMGAINFSLFYFLINGRVGKFFKDEELRWFLSIIIIAALLVGINLFVTNNYAIPDSFRVALFQVVSVITTTGFSTADFSLWGPFCLFLFMLLMVICGCAGSTSGGLKMVRAVVLAKNTLCEFKRLIHPRAIIPVRLNGSALAFGIVQRLLAFAFLYICIIFVSWGILTLVGMPFDEALGASVSLIGNVGPGFGSLSGFGSYAEIPVFAKWYLSFLMIIGRLEIFTFLILFTPAFWKR
ncbi:MAG: TrkH family potassium uptake protein [Dysgonamonadaceae bacterium]|jgi:trk system potassium uptake protein TrkH|nr:TrkH family potassium uptake protein [Dysgonamonadaceae bacterium]